MGQGKEDIKKGEKKNPKTMERFVLSIYSKVHFFVCLK